MKVTMEEDFMPEDVSDMIKFEVREMIKERIKEQTDKAVKDAFDERISMQIDDIIKGFLKTPMFEIPDGYNKPLKMVTLEDKLQIAFNNYFNAEVKEYDGQTPGYSDKKMKRIDYIIKTAALPVYEGNIRGELNESVKKIKEGLVQITTEQMTKKIGEMMQTMFIKK